MICIQKYSIWNVHIYKDKVGYNYASRKIVSLVSDQITNAEEIVDGGAIYTIMYDYEVPSAANRDPDVYYLRFAPPQIEAVLTNQTETTDEDGIININIAPGKYRIKETKPPTGYEYKNETFNVEIMENSAKSITITNKKTTTHKITTDVKEYKIGSRSN